MIFRKLSFICILTTVVACSQETSIIPSDGTAKRHKTKATIVPDYQSESPNADPGNFAKSYVKPVSINGSVTYHSIYGGFDLNFGASFPYPTVVNAYENYSKYIPSIGSVLGSPNPLYQFKMGPDGSALQLFS